MNFAEVILNRSGEATALISTSKSVSYAELESASKPEKFCFETGDLILFLFDYSVEHIILYVAAVRSSAVPILIGRDATSEYISKLVSIYSPVWAVGLNEPSDPRTTSGLGDVGVTRLDARNVPQKGFRNLAVLIPTSGSTGDPKMVRLSHDSIKACTQEIVSYLNIGDGQTLTTSLPLNYSYGLSILHSSLMGGARLFVEKMELFDKSYWEKLESFEVSMFSSVPAVFISCMKRGLFDLFPESLQTITVAGGKLDSGHTKRLVEQCNLSGRRFFSMYGATEASPRMSFVPATMALEKIGSAGIPLKCGRFEIDSFEGSDSGEIVYYGENVALGYASEPLDLVKEDEFQGCFRTGDFGFLDADGYLFVQGRMKRFAKASGLSVNLDHLELLLLDQGLDVIAVAANDFICIGHLPDDRTKIWQTLAEKTTLSKAAVKFLEVTEIPLSSYGKKDYSQFIKDFSIEEF